MIETKKKSYIKNLILVGFLYIDEFHFGAFRMHA